MTNKKKLKGKSGGFGTVLIGSGLLLITAALALLFYNIYDDLRAQETVESVLNDFPNQIVESHAALDRAMPTREIDGYRYIGRLSIPAVELDLPILEEWDDKRSKISPCRYSGTVYENNLILCGHNYVSHFGRLKNLVQGDTIDFTDMDGIIWHYQVEEIETIPGTAIEKMKGGDWDLTLFTCNMSGEARVTVRCSFCG